MDPSIDQFKAQLENREVDDEIPRQDRVLEKTQCASMNKASSRTNSRMSKDPSWNLDAMINSIMRSLCSIF